MIETETITYLISEVRYTIGRNFRRSNVLEKLSMLLESGIEIMFHF